MANLKCENCKFYSHTANILGGVVKCNKEIKSLNTFWPNDACDKFEATNEDKLKAQNDFYKECLDGVIKIGQRKLELGEGGYQPIKKDWNK